MELTSTGNFFKFKVIGDNIEGLFVSYTSNVPGKFGPENQLVLETETGNTLVRCPASLARTLSDNAKRLPGKVLNITYTGDKPSTKGNPMKCFRVESNDPKPVNAMTDAAESPIPF